MQLDVVLTLTWLWPSLLVMLDIVGALVDGSLTSNSNSKNSNENTEKSDLLFPNVTQVFEARLTCENTVPSGGKYHTDTWSCYNMKIDGKRLRYWQPAGFGKEERAKCKSEKCKVQRTEGSQYDFKNDYGGLCVQLFQSHGINRPLWAAHVDEASSRRTTGPRMTFVANGNTYKWQEYPAGRGYVKTLRCVTQS